MEGFLGLKSLRTFEKQAQDFHRKEIRKVMSKKIIQVSVHKMSWSTRILNNLKGLPNVCSYGQKQGKCCACNG